MECLPYPSTLWWHDFPPKRKFQGTLDIHEVRPEEMVVLAKALQHCTERSGAIPCIICGAVRDLWECLVPLLSLHDEDIWEDFLLESAGDEPVTSLIHPEEALLLGEVPEPQGALASASLVPFQLGEAPLQPDNNDSTTDPPDIR